ncbi:hypothetical protein LMH87_011131 [Akanthomyces muscarius]|uniref:Arylsulfotransferase n=1 Tax=Akanthomyces muscarius TaxID=2231603 RepID=A0A9W8UKG1_AKAMU|nr:hypothetical protein LMH87_011131 [Akanthomyces muscarius]KAJ4150379.1 hypothetical protein LMH87_011131 [Akanthomyces muscarius]
MRQVAKILQFAVLVAGTTDSLSPHPSPHFKTFCGPTPPQLETWHSKQPCDDGLLFVASGVAASAATANKKADVEGPAIFRTNGDLVWTQSGWGRTSDLKVQMVGDRSYITFWHYESSRDDRGGSYVVLNQSYGVIRELRPVGEAPSRPVELKLTDNGTAIMMMHRITQVDKPFRGLQSGWINDAIIQEVDMASNELIFEWRASQHFDVETSQADIKNQGRTAETAFDFFHATGIDIDHNGNYVISSQNMCNAAALHRTDGHMLWVLGGALNSFEDIATGQTVAMISSQGIQWHGDSTLLLLDGGYVPHVEGQAGRRSNARMIHLNTTTNTAVLLRTYSTPAAVASRHSKGGLQRLRSGHVFVGWGDGDPSAVAYTEYSRSGRPLCTARFRKPSAPLFAGYTKTSSGGSRGRVISKYAWTGTPAAQPAMVVRPQESALYVSWNGDTQTTAWVLRSNNTERGDGSLGARRVVEKTGFETRILIPRDVGEVMEIIGVDGDGKELVRSELIWSEGASGTWSTQRVVPEEHLAAAQDKDASPPWPLPWHKHTLSRRRCQLMLALSGVGLMMSTFLWCRWTAKQRRKKSMQDGGSWCQQQTVLSGEKSMA